MGAEEQTTQNGMADVAVNEAARGDAGGAPAVPPPEEPPKMEEIVTMDVLQEIIKGYNPDMSLVSWQAKPGSKIGDNYMSIMYSVQLELESKTDKKKETLEVMLKTIPRNVFRADMINEMKAFKKEATIYQQILPIFVEVQNAKEMGDDEVFAPWPKCYAAHVDGQTDFLAMENLKVSGYTMGSRKLGLDFNHCSAVVRCLAKFHAISFVKYGGDREKILKDFPILTGGMFDKENKLAQMQQQFFAQSFKHQAGTLRDMGEELAGARLDRLAETDFFTVMGNMLEKDIECAVISHGDCWVNNMLFKYSDKDKKLGCPESVNFIDFQISQATSRMVDFYYFLMTSAKLDVLSQREDDLLMIYYSEFTSYAETFGVNTKEKGLTYDNLVKEAGRYRLYGIFMALLLAPMLAADAEDIPDMETFTQEDFENADETMKKFFSDLTHGFASLKAKTIVLEHLPKCVNGQEYL